MDNCDPCNLEEINGCVFCINCGEQKDDVVFYKQGFRNHIARYEKPPKSEEPFNFEKEKEKVAKKIREYNNTPEISNISFQICMMFKTNRRKK